MARKSKKKGFNLFAEMRKGDQTFSDRSDAFNSAVGGDTDTVDTTMDLSVEERAVIALTKAVKDYRSTIKGNGLGKKTIDGFKEITRNALGVKRMGEKRYFQIIDLCPELEVITKDSGRRYFGIIEPATIEEDSVEEEHFDTTPPKAENKTEKKVVALFEQYLSDKEKHCDEDGHFVSVCPSCGSRQMELYLDSKKKLRCGGCNDLHWEDSYNIYPYQVSSTDIGMITSIRAWGKKTKKGIKYKGWLLTKEDKLVRVEKPIDQKHFERFVNHSGETVFVYKPTERFRAKIKSANKYL